VEDGVGKDERVLERQPANLETQTAKLEDALEDRPDYGLREGDPAITRCELNHTLLDQLRERRGLVRHVLLRAEGGTYGRCVRYGDEVHPDRLAVLPDTRLCADCA
jgi:RNA polymerase-binding transcription factor DksA